MNIGLDKIHYAIITEDSSGNESFGTPKPFAKAITAQMDVNTSSTPFYADDMLDEQFDDFVEGKLRLNLKELTPTAQKDIFGVVEDANGVLISTAEDTPKPVAILFRSLVKKDTYAYFVLYRVQFAQPSRSFNTKSNSITINTPTVEGTFMRLHKSITVNGKVLHPWRAALPETVTTASVIENWFTQVYEYTAPAAQSSQSSTPSSP